MLDDRFKEALKKREKNKSILESLKNYYEEEISNKEIMIDILAANEGRDLISEAIYRPNNQETILNVQNITKDISKNDKYIVIDKTLSVINLGVIKDTEDNWGYGHSLGGKECINRYRSINMYGRLPGVFYPIGFKSMRIYKSHAACKLSKPFIIYVCEVRAVKDSDESELVIETEDGLYFKGKEKWREFVGLFHDGVEFEDMESFIGLKHDSVVEMFYEL